MTMIAKIFRTYISPWNLGLSLGKVHCFPRKVPFPKENSFLPRKVVFFTK
jgi:hypothetical protein